jgi:hypothetical protein
VVIRHGYDSIETALVVIRHGYDSIIQSDMNNAVNGLTMESGR